MTDPRPMADRIHRNFLGTWSLDPETCDYEQGEPPRADRHHIAEDAGDLVITMDWTDADGETHHASFRAPLDGSKMPFNGGPLADALQLKTPSSSELSLSAFCDGLELMTAMRTMSTDSSSLLLVQTVHLADFTAPENRGTYFRVN